MSVFVFALSCGLMAFMFGLYFGQRGREHTEFQFQTLLEGLGEVLTNAEYFSNQAKLGFINDLKPYVSEILQDKLSELERIFDAKITYKK